MAGALVWFNRDLRVADRAPLSDALVTRGLPLLEATGEAVEVLAAWNIENLGRPLRPTDGSYFCPKCKNMSLQFRDSGLCWD